MGSLAPLTMRNVLQFDDLESMLDLLKTSMDGYEMKTQISQIVNYQDNEDLMNRLNWNEDDHLLLQLFCNMYQYLIDENAINIVPEENDLDIVTTLLSAFIPNYFRSLVSGEITFRNYKIDFS